MPGQHTGGGSRRKWGETWAGSEGGRREAKEELGTKNLSQQCTYEKVSVGPIPSPQTNIICMRNLPSSKNSPTLVPPALPGHWWEGAQRKYGLSLSTAVHLKVQQLEARRQLLHTGDSLEGDSEWHTFTAATTSFPKASAFLFTIHIYDRENAVNLFTKSPTNKTKFSPVNPSMPCIFYVYHTIAREKLGSNAWKHL